MSRYTLSGLVCGYTPEGMEPGPLARSAESGVGIVSLKPADKPDQQMSRKIEQGDERLIQGRPKQASQEQSRSETRNQIGDHEIASESQKLPRVHAGHCGIGKFPAKNGLAMGDPVKEIDLEVIGQGHSQK